jgi:hypothetical protein
MNADVITIPANLVRYLRCGVQSQLSARLERLAVALEGRIDAPGYQRALSDFDAARVLLDSIGVSDGDAQVDLELDLSTSPELVLKALEAQHRCEVARLQDAAAHGVEIHPRDVPELGSLVDEVRRKVSVSEIAKRADSVSEKRGALRAGRSRGHG